MAETYKKEFEEGKRISAKGYATRSRDGKFEPFEFTRHKVGENDIIIKILYAGICHSDIHSARSEWKDEIYPMVPGHEIVGRVDCVGPKVTKFKVGDHAAVGCMVNSCKNCEVCKRGEEQFCAKTVYTYGSKDCFHDDDVTYGGYSSNIVVSEEFAVKVPEGADLERVAPLVCAGITTYSPLRFTKVGPGDEVGVVGCGGLGHMAVQYAASFGANVTVFATSEGKRELAFKLGAKHFVNTRNPKEMEGLKGKFRVILNTVSSAYNMNMYTDLLKLDGEMVLLGVPPRDNPPTINISSFTWTPRRKVYSSMIGGIPQTQEMLDYSVKNKIYPMVEMIPIQKIDEAYERVIKCDVKFRFVIDMKSLA